MQKPFIQIDQSKTSIQGRWLIIALCFLFVASVATNIFLIKRNTSGGKTHVVALGDTTWVGRTVKDDGKDTYQLIKIDTKGQETVMYETSFTPYGSMRWDFSKGDGSFIVSDTNAAGDASETTEIAFQHGVETIRSHYSSYEEELSFTVPGSPIYTVAFATTGTCTGIVKRGDVAPQTKLLGIQINSDNGLKTFNLPKPQTVPCETNQDGDFIKPRMSNVRTSVSSVGFDLPNNDPVRISTRTLPELLVEFD